MDAVSLLWIHFMHRERIKESMMRETAPGIVKLAKIEHIKIILSADFDYDKTFTCCDLLLLLLKD
jgi:hypothetical protein